MMACVCRILCCKRCTLPSRTTSSEGGGGGLPQGQMLADFLDGNLIRKALLSEHRALNAAMHPTASVV